LLTPCRAGHFWKRPGNLAAKSRFLGLANKALTKTTTAWHLDCNRIRQGDLAVLSNELLLVPHEAA
jgi:hypothetical protein